jgi:ABC-type nickel/cobalt efflux system permease component RcnA
MTVAMFALSSMYWIMSVVVTFIVVDVWQSQFFPVPRNAPDWLPMFSAVLLINVGVYYKSRSHIIIIRERP